MLGQDEIKTIKSSDIYYDNYWSKSIITEVVNEDVPIPEGLEYMQGTKDTGVIVKDKNNNNMMLWIPYDDSVTEEGLKEYYQNCNYIPMDIETEEAIAKYGGFYVTLENTNQYETLKLVENESYTRAYMQAQNRYQDSKTMNSHLLSKTELAQILAYSQKIGLAITPTKAEKNTGYPIQLTTNEETVGEIALPGNLTPGVSVVTPATYDTSTSNETVIVEFDKQKVVIPGGFKQCTYVGKIALPNYHLGVNSDIDNKLILKICDEKNEKLRYVWVPVSEKEFIQMVDTMKGYYSNHDVMFEFDKLQAIENENYQALLKSIATYGGFYIAEAELGYDANHNIINQARGMKPDSKDGFSIVNIGEYYRGTEVGSYENALAIANSIHEENDNVTSHLMYGAEWDATMLWLLKTKAVTEEQLIKDSSTVAGAKYQNTMKLDENGNLEDNDLEALNGIYGLAGNLIELTQETAQVDNEVYRTLRGGAYCYSGNMWPMASRLQLKTEKIAEGKDIGFRNCLYLNPEVIENGKYFEITNNGEISVKEEYKKGGSNENNMAKEIEVPERLNGIKVTSIAKGGFENCKEIEQVILPDSISNIKEKAFSNCVSLKSVTMSDAITGIASYAFENCQSLQSIYVPMNTETVYSNAFKDCINMKEVIFGGKKLSSIYTDAFRNCKKLDTITIEMIPEELQKNDSDFLIETKAFRKCNKEKVLNISEDADESTIQYLQKTIGNIKEDINKIVSYTVVENQVNGIYGYAEGYVYGATNEEAWSIKTDTIKQLVEYYRKNRLTLKKEEMETKLTDIRQEGEKKIETVLQSYRDSSYQSGIEDYMTQWHSDIADEQWVISAKEEKKNKIKYLNDMTEVYNVTVEFQQMIEQQLGNLNQVKQDLVNEIGEYVPYWGWDFMSYWYTDMNNNIKTPAIAKIWEAKTEEEAIEIKNQCETDIENYVTPIIQRKYREQYEAYQAKSAKQQAAKSSKPSTKKSYTTNSGAQKTSETQTITEGKVRVPTTVYNEDGTSYTQWEWVTYTSI